MHVRHGNGGGHNEPCPNTPETIRVCIDEDCPSCGWGERWADVEMTSAGPTPILFGCNKCDYRSKVRDA
ncbi:hypothetical protein [Rhodococcus koreensis]|uniref:hypothetical protein n=1 Tax=Rhodococcus koreensis TaxID=99653 RepID=UPI003671304A